MATHLSLLLPIVELRNVLLRRTLSASLEVVVTIILSICSSQLVAATVLVHTHN